MGSLLECDAHPTRRLLGHDVVAQALGCHRVQGHDALRVERRRLKEWIRYDAGIRDAQALGGHDLCRPCEAPQVGRLIDERGGDQEGLVAAARAVGANVGLAQSFCVRMPTTQAAAEERTHVREDSPHGNLLGTLREARTTIESVWVVSTEDALVAGKCLTKEGLSCCGVSFE